MHNIKVARKVFSCIIILLAILTSSATAVCPVGDLNNSGTVDIADLEVLVGAWLGDQSCSGCSCPDLN